MERVKADADWSTFDPDACKGLNDCYGEEYNKLYLQYESDGKAVKTHRARDIWSAIFQSQKESGLPYMLYKDNVNKYNNQANMGVIKSSNLCCEITIYSDHKEFSTCVLGSAVVPSQHSSVPHCWVMHTSGGVAFGVYPAPQSDTLHAAALRIS